MRIRQRSASQEFPEFVIWAIIEPIDITVKA